MMMDPFRYRYAVDTEHTPAETTYISTGPRTEADLLAEQAEDRAEMGHRPSSDYSDPEDIGA